MSEKKSHENSFKFSLYQENDLVIERSFSADVFNPMARYSVNIKEIIPSIIQRLQKLLSKRDATYKVDYGDEAYDLLGNYQTSIKVNKNFSQNKLTIPEAKSVDITDGKGNVLKTITGVEWKFCFYINNNMIVERLLYVDKYNPAIRFSTEIVDTVNEITEDIFEIIKKNDVNNIWDDFNIINAYGFSHINNVRELTKEQRQLYLKNISDPNFIRSVKSQFKKPVATIEDDTVSVDE